MLELIIGAKGNGKTRKMVERANNESKRTSGSIIYELPGMLMEAFIHTL